MHIRKKPASLLLTIGLVFWGIAYASPAISAQAKLFNQLLETSKAEMAKKGGVLTVTLEWPEDEGKAVLEAFKKEFPFIKEIAYERTRTVDAMQRVLLEFKAGRSLKYDIMHVSMEAWPAYQEAGAFPKPPFSYKELVKSLPSDWPTPDPRSVDPKGEYIATTGLVRGIAYNKNIVPPDKAPRRWDDCLDPMWRGKFLYDPRSKLTALQHDPKTREAHLKWLKGIMENKVVLNRGQTENVQKVASGEYPLVCGVNYHSSTREMDQGAPVIFVVPDPYPMEFGSQMRVVKWSKTPATSQLFGLWVATKGEQPAYREFPWNPGSRKAPLVKGKYAAVCDVECLKRSEEYDAEHARILKLPGAK